MNRSMFALPLVLLVVGTTAGMAAPQPRSAPDRKGETLSGAQLYVSTGCTQCHGLVGQGGNAGPRLAAKNYTLEAFTKLVREPLEEMPPYTERVLDAGQMARLHAYVATLK